VRDDAAQEPVVLAIPDHLGDHLAVQEPEVADVARDLDGRQPRQQPVERVGRAALERRVPPGTALGEGDARSRLPCVDQLEADLGRVLEVGVHDHDGVAGRSGVEPGGHRDLVTEVPGQRDHGDAVVVAAQPEQHIEGRVAAAVVDVDELEVQVGPFGGRRDQGVVEDVEDVLLVVHRQHVGDQAAVGGHVE